jgi:hypothetical protein
LNHEKRLGRSILDNLCDLAVDVNGLIVPGQLIGSVLSRHAFNLVVNRNDEVYKISLVGSGTAVRYRGREILLVTKHQLRDIDPQQVAMLTDDNNIITSGGLRYCDGKSDSDAYDIVAFDFTAPCVDRPELKKRFFDLRGGAPPAFLNVKVLAIMLSGFPVADQAYEVYEKNHIGLARRNITCEPDGQPSDEALLRVRAVQPLEVDPDGMSGGSAFVIQLVDGQPRAYFGGIVVRGGRKFFSIVKPGIVIAFLDAVFGP